MSISNSLHNALSGLQAAGRQAEVIAANVANASTPGYGRREVELAAHSLGGKGAGVMVVGISRHTDPQIVGERRLADASVSMNAERTDFFQRMERAIGLPGDTNSLTNRVTQFEASLIEAASAPENDTRLRSVLTAATALSDKINSASNELQDIRMEADRSIAVQIKELNEGLNKVVDLNTQIQHHLTSGRDAAALMDQRQVLIDRIAEIVPVKEVPRPNGQVSLYTPGGAILVDSKAAELGFAPVGVVTPDMTVASGALSGLTINGQPTSTSSPRSPIEGGSLAALFEVRDELAVTAQKQLDAVARDLMERFEDSSLDPTITTGAAGLFTDGGSALDILDEVGLAGRLSVNAMADPARGGDLWRLRSGLYATVPNESGDATIIHAMADALSTNKVQASGGFSPIARSVLGLSSEMLSMIETGLVSSESETTFATAQSDTLRAIELSDGVDTDKELQHLLIVEQAFSANARVIQTVDALISQLLEM